MKNSNAPSPSRAADYEAIEAALLETVQGRGFLMEYSNRNRRAETVMLLEAISKLEATALKPHADDGNSTIRRDLVEMAEAISRTRKEIASMQTSEQDDGPFATVKDELDAIVEVTDKAKSEIYQAAGDVRELARLLREKGAEDEACDRLDACATATYSACYFLNLTGRRMNKIVKVLRFLEGRLDSMISIGDLDQLGENQTKNEASAEETSTDDAFVPGIDLQQQA